ncbi:hypothetical protein SAMN04488112_102181 [Melghirimyces thermohalophilus]|uniref:Uncharacterized protein n=1 Tax=Melghirimyces thermohalophilus TaxID=1236220 RepID=A0A1G6IDN9_9BACL|nr:hypothetical protein SAMN04488112_102181 [Melghirimyces thermohalophilus]
MFNGYETELARIRHEEIKNQFREINRLHRKRHSWIQSLRSIWNNFDKREPQHVKQRLSCCSAPLCCE